MADNETSYKYGALGAWDQRFNQGGIKGDYRGSMSAKQTPTMFQGERSVHLDPNRYEHVGYSLEDTLSGFQR